MALVAITRDDLDSAGLRAAAAGTRDVRHARRLLALAVVLDGHPRLLAAQTGGMDRQIMRDWVRRYNAEGVEGVRDAKRGGRPPALSAEQMQALEELVLAGPDLAEDGVVRWCCLDLRAQIKARFEVEVHWRLERDYQDLKQELGLGHYEGRGWRGFHHHATLCIAAYGFLIAERGAFPPSHGFWPPFFKAPALPEDYRPRGTPDPA